MEKEERTLNKIIWERAVKEADYYDDKENYDAHKKLIKIAIEETKKQKNKENGKRN